MRRKNFTNREIDMIYRDLTGGRKVRAKPSKSVDDRCTYQNCYNARHENSPFGMCGPHDLRADIVLNTWEYLFEVYGRNIPSWTYEKERNA